IFARSDSEKITWLWESLAPPGMGGASFWHQSRWGATGRRPRACGFLRRGILVWPRPLWVQLDRIGRGVTRPSMSALPPKADIDRRYDIVRLVPKADITRCSKLAPVSAAFLQFLVGPHHGGGRDRRNDLAGSYDRTRVVRDIDVEGSMHHLV